MGTIIHFNPPQRTAPPVAAGDDLPECQIVIFPGVRIERHAIPFSDGAFPPETDGGTEHGNRPRRSS